MIPSGILNLCGSCLPALLLHSPQVLRCPLCSGTCLKALAVGPSSGAAVERGGLIFFFHVSEYIKLECNLELLGGLHVPLPLR